MNPSRKGRRAAYGFYEYGFYVGLIFWVFWVFSIGSCLWMLP